MYEYVTPSFIYSPLQNIRQLSFFGIYMSYRSLLFH